MRNTLTFLMLFVSLYIQGQSCKLFTTDRELSSSLINHIYQDSDGMIWIATEDGLNRYDGSKFITYRHDDDEPHSLLHNYVRTVFEDSKGHLLIGTYRGLQMYNPAEDNFTLQAQRENGKPFETNIIDITERQNGDIWVSGNELCTLHIHDSLLVMKEITLPFSTIHTDYMIEDRNQNMWVARGEDGVYRINPEGQVTHYLEQENEISIVELCEDMQGDIFLATSKKGILKYDREKNTFLPIIYKEKQNLSIKCFLCSNQNELYIGTDGQGVKVYHNKKQEITDLPFDNIYFDSNTSKVHSILKDNAGNFWYAIYQKGVLMIPAQPNNFKYIGYKSIDKNIVGSNSITSLCKGHDGIMWVGTDNDGIYGISRNGRQEAHFQANEGPNSVPSIVISLFEDSRQNLWVGSFLKGIGKLDTRTGRCTYLEGLEDKNGKQVQRVYGFAEDQNNRLWIATMGGGLFYHDLNAAGSRPYFHRVDLDYTNDWMNCILCSKDNKLYTGTYDGAYCIDLNVSEIQSQQILPRCIIFSICEDRANNIWLACSDGLHKYDPQTQEIATYTTRDGLPSNTIYGVQADNQGDLWISTNAGLSHFQPAINRFVNYYVSDGLQGNEFSKNASFKDERGNLWFGGTNGITYFDPQAITSPSKKWNIRITDFYLHDHPVRKGMYSGGHEIIDCPVYEAKDFYLGYNDNTFTIEFSTREFNRPERITYLYAMEDHPWVNLPVGVNRVSFGNLPPGTYHFRVKAVDYPIYSNEQEITIHILPPWWETWWAKLIYLCLILGGIFYVIMAIRHRYQVKQERLQHLHAEQLNEAKLQFFINISHEIRTPMSLIISPLQKLISSDDDSVRQKIYRTIYRNAQRILLLINQLMDIRKIDKGQMLLVFRETEIIGFINDICDTFAQQARKKNITLQFHHPEGEELKLWVDPRNFDKIILNLLSNSYKFTPENGTVDVYLRTGEDENATGPLKHYAEIMVVDSGIGIAPNELENIFQRFYQIRNSENNSNMGTGIGLHLTRSLVNLHHGNVHAENNPEGQPGCRFIIRIPLGNAHLRPDELDTHSTVLPTHAQMLPASLPDEPEDKQGNEKKPRTKTSYHVLVVEDEEEIRQYICKELSDEYHTIESINGKDALEQIFKHTPDLVISDVMMPEMDGFTLCQKIKQNVNLNHIPVILLTAKTKEEDNIEGLEIGADAYITKPFNLEILRKMVENLIKSRNRLRNTFSGQQTQEEQLEKIDAQSSDDKLMGRIMKVINDNLSNPNLTVEMITTEVGISRVHLHRKLKELTNQSTRDFIRNIRLKQAATLLSEKKYTIAEVTELTGFSNPNNFSTAFKELYGVSPKVYREQHLNEK